MPFLHLLPLIAALVGTVTPATAIELEPIEIQVTEVTLFGLGGPSGPPPQSRSLDNPDPNCTVTGTATASVVDGELELAVNLEFITGSSPQICDPRGIALFTGGVTVPDLGGAETVVVFELVESMNLSGGVLFEVTVSEFNRDAVSMLLGGKVELDRPSQTISTIDDTFDRRSSYIDLIAGDTLSEAIFQIVSEYQATGPNQTETVNANYRIRAYVVKPTELPEPSTTLGIVSGVALLGVLSNLRAGR